MRLGLNIDHIATLREARKINDPDPLEAIFIAKNTGVSQITIHLREDRRHINDLDVKRIIQSSPLPVNIECSINDEIVDFICNQKPYKVTLVPEKREEVTTEGGLSMTHIKIKDVIKLFQSQNILVTTFIDPCLESIELSKEYKANGIEIHTGKYANIFLMLYSNLKRTPNSIKSLEDKDLKSLLDDAIREIKTIVKKSKDLGLYVCAGHGLNYLNVKEIAKISEIEELNIGQSIIAKSVFVGLEKAIKDMLDLIN
ncbi:MULTISPECIES: pyridoxine 5'-phosphate synthase [unclassified Helicobacter]|uniref:pyridoxine 5'-phosphate synthase n=1 Tax=unclassified Helicobacter TaxID=2593540 RepID=UPI000CF07F1B|nr:MULTISPECIES: pyridoxine 5'-phosphate synthase [unclassified Helicobacter]